MPMKRIPRPISPEHRLQLAQARAALARKLQAVRRQIEIPELGKPSRRRLRVRPRVVVRSEQAELFDPPDLLDWAGAAPSDIGAGLAGPESESRRPLRMRDMHYHPTEIAGMTGRLAMLELSRAAGFTGNPPLMATPDTVLDVLEATETDLDPDGNLVWIESARVARLEHGRQLRELVGPD